MVALDSNVIVRYIVQDDKLQAKKATHAIENLSSDNQGFVTCVVLCEVNWGLKCAYNITKDERVKVLQYMLSVASFDVEQSDCCLKALRAFETGKADYSDYLIGEISQANGYEKVLTFDKKAQKSPYFTGL